MTTPPTPQEQAERTDGPTPLTDKLAEPCIDANCVMLARTIERRLAAANQRISEPRVEG